MSRCEAKTGRRSRCHCQAVERLRVRYSDGERLFQVCRLHATAIRSQTFRPAVDRPVEGA